MQNYGNGSGYSRMKVFNSGGYTSGWENLYNNGTIYINIPKPVTPSPAYHAQIGEGDL